MAHNLTLFVPEEAPFALDEVTRLAGEAVVTPTTEDGALVGCVVEYPRVRLAIRVMPEDDVGDHLLGFGLYLTRTSSGGIDDRLQAVLDRVSATQMVIEVVVDPGYTGGGPAGELIAGLVRHLCAMLFAHHVLYDEEMRFLHSPSVKIPPGEDTSTERQKARAARSKALLEARKAPLYNGALFVDDDEEARVRTPREVAERTMALWAVAIRGENAPRDQVRAILDRAGVWDAVSPEERAFLDDAEPDAGTMGSFVWRLEAIEVLLWALGRLPELAWPKGFCDVPRLSNKMIAAEGDPAFLAEATLRPTADLLDAQDLTLRQHWAIRNCYLQGEPIPADLDWSGSAERLDVRACPVTGVVAERHRALNWLLCFGDDDWDDVDTPT